MWNDIANMSAIATLILFIFYFLGRLWCIRVEKKDLYEKIIVRGVDLKDNDLNYITKIFELDKSLCR